MTQSGSLLFFCGKMGAGKTTHAVRLAQELRAVLISEDEWLAKLYPDEISNFDDYLKFSARIKPLLKTHVQAILKSGVSVVMDFPGNTRNQRAWLLQICNKINAKHQLIFLNLSDQECLKNLKRRRTIAPERAMFDTEQMFQQVRAYFQAPAADEGLTILTLADSERKRE
jgi:predicted kinase